MAYNKLSNGRRNAEQCFKKNFHSDPYLKIATSRVDTITMKLRVTL